MCVLNMCENTKKSIFVKPEGVYDIIDILVIMHNTNNF